MKYWLVGEVRTLNQEVISSWLILQLQQMSTPTMNVVKSILAITPKEAASDAGIIFTSSKSKNT